MNYLLFFSENSEMAGCISRLIYENLKLIILQMINVVRSLIRFCIHYLGIVGSAEQTALAVCSLVGVSLYNGAGCW